MSYNLLIQDEAVNDIQQAYEWYKEKKESLGTEFIAEVENCFDRICKNPLHYGYISPKFRRILTNRFPYKIVYEVTSDTIIVNSVDHNKRNKSHL
jgi:plasmid stabilization system protein ParE